MSFEQKDVEAVARLARLQVSPEEAKAFSSELSKILSYVEKLSELATDDVPPTAQVAVNEAPLREDVAREGIDQSEVFAQAPRANDLGFLVPQFVDEG